MRKLFLIFFMTPALSFGQGKSISLVKKSVEPYVTFSKDTVKINQEILILEGSNTDGSFKYIQMLNSFNEPISRADSRSAMKRQKIKFFKEQDGTTYMFTKFYVINIEAALISKELSLRNSN